MRSLEDAKAEFTKRGVRVVGVSVDPPAVSKKHAAEQGFSMLFLSDEDGRVLKEWDLLHEDAHDGHDISRPAEFLVDSSGVVRWRNLSDNFMVRMDAADALEAIDTAQKP